MNDIHPGKLKRKSRKTSTFSVVDLPAVTSTTTTGNLLGDALFDPEPSSPDTRPENLLERITDSSDTSDISDSDLFGAQDSDASKRTVQRSDVRSETSLKAASPLDMLKSDEDSQLEQFAAGDTSQRKVIKIDADPASSQSLASVRRKKLKPKDPVVFDEDKDDAQDVVKLEQILRQAQDINQKCLDTLVKLQNTNAQNERRYALYLTIAFSILTILTVVGVYVGVNMHNKSKDSELRLKHDSYQSILEAKKVIEDEFERDKAGSKAAFEVYQYIEEGMFVESVDKFNEVRDTITHPAEIALLEQRIDDIRWKIAENAYNDGLSLFQSNNYEQARDYFLKSLQYKENTSYLPRLYYYLAMSCFNLNDYEGARRYFSQIHSSDLNAEMDANAKYYHGIAAEKLGDDADAFDQYDQFLKKYRYHSKADEVVKKRARVESARQNR